MELERSAALRCSECQSRCLIIIEQLYSILDFHLPDYFNKYMKHWRLTYFVISLVLVELLVIVFVDLDQDLLMQDSRNFPYEFVEVSRFSTQNRWFFYRSGAVNDTIFGLADLKQVGGQVDYAIRDLRGRALFYETNIGLNLIATSYSHIDIDNDGTTEVILTKVWPQTEIRTKTGLHPLDSIALYSYNPDIIHSEIEHILTIRRPDNWNQEDSLWSMDLYLPKTATGEPFVTEDYWYIRARGGLANYRSKKLYVLSRTNNSIVNVVDLADDGCISEILFSDQDSILVFNTVTSCNGLELNVEQIQLLDSTVVDTLNDCQVGITIRNLEGEYLDFVHVLDGAGHSYVFQTPSDSILLLVAERNRLAQPNTGQEIYVVQYDYLNRVVVPISNTIGAFAQVFRNTTNIDDPIGFICSDVNNYTPVYSNGTQGESFKFKPLNSLYFTHISLLSGISGYICSIEDGDIVLIDAKGEILAFCESDFNEETVLLRHPIRRPIRGLIADTALEVLPVETNNSLILYHIRAQENHAWWLWRKKWLFVTLLLPTLAIIAVLLLIRYILTKNEMIRSLRSLNLRLNRVQEEERSKIAKDIHDDIGQKLTVLKWSAANLAEEEDSEEAQSPLVASIDELIHDVRRISSELRPGIIDDAGVHAAISWLVEQIRQKSALPVKLTISAEPEPADPDLKIAVYRFVQEGLSNVLKHAQASEVEVRVQNDSGNYLVTITDNGIGIQTEKDRGRRKLGLVGMKERMSQFDGEVTLENRMEGGAKLQLIVPMENW